MNYKVDFEELNILVSNWSWQELKFGLSRNLIAESDIISYAMQILAEDIVKYDLVLELSIASEDEVAELLESLIESEVLQTLEAIESKWVFSIIYFAYSYEPKRLYEIIDDVYSGFDYPEEIKNFVGYMPCEDGRDIEEKIVDYIKENIEKQ